MSNQLEQLKKMSIVVADTAEFSLLEKFGPQDATTNPSLVLAGSLLPQYTKLVDDAIAYGRRHGKTPAEILEETTDKLTVNFGLEILKLIPGRVSTEVDAKYSFDTERSVAKAKKLVGLYRAAGIGKERLYIKLASTWEGIQAARQLEAEGIQCNLTLLFSFAQAVACAQAGVALISPFVGRIMDWYKKNEPKRDISGEKDPGVQSVTRIYNYYKAHGYKTIVMGASFRNISEIQLLAGCDKITIAPSLLDQLAKETTPLKRRLNPKVQNPEKKLAPFTQSDFLFLHNEDPMAVEKLAEGIRNFNKDTRKLEAYLQGRIQPKAKL